MWRIFRLIVRNSGIRTRECILTKRIIEEMVFRESCYKDASAKDGKAKENSFHLALSKLPAKINELHDLHGTDESIYQNFNVRRC